MPMIPARRTIPVAVLLLAVVAGILLLWDRPQAADDLTTARQGSALEQGDAAQQAAKAKQSAGPISRADVAPGSGDARTTDHEPRVDVGTLIRVFDPQGKPAVGASVLPWLGTELWRKRITDERGEVWVEGLRGAGGLVVKLVGWRPAKKMMVFDGQEVEWHQQDGLAVSGRLHCAQIQGDFPAISLSLRDRDWRPSWEDIPRDVFHDLEDLGWNLAMVPMPVHGDGSFRLDGLAPDWKGRINMPPGYFAVDFKGPGEVEDPEELSLEEPAEGLVLEVMRLPTLSGQLLTPDGSAPAAGVQVHAALVFPDGAETPWLRGVSDEQGYFVLPLVVYSNDAHQDWIAQARVPAATRIQLKTFTAEVGDSVNLEFHPAELEDPWDLGQIHLLQRNSLPFRAVDPDGNPIAKAYGFAGEISAPTDADGFGEVYVPQEGKRVAFKAEGYAMLEYHIPKDLEPPAIIELQPANQLVVRLQYQEGLRMNKRIQAIAHGQLYGDSQFRRDGRSAMDAVLGDHYRQYSFGDAESEQTYWHLPADVDEFLLEDLKPGVEFMLQWIDNTTTVLASSEPISLKAGERRQVTLRYEQPLHHLWGVVLDPTGNPVGDAQLQIQPEGGAGAWAETTADGRFDFGWLRSQEIELQLSKTGFALRHWPKFHIPGDDGGVELRLSPIRELRLHVVDGHGRGLGQAHIAYGMEWRQDYASWKPELGHHVVETAPLGAFEVELRIGGVEMKRTVPADVSDFDLVVETAGGASLRLLREQADQQWMLELDFEAIDGSVEPLPSDQRWTGWIDEDVSEALVSMPALMEGRYRVQAEIKSTEDWSEVFDGVLVEELRIKAGEITTL